MTKYDTTYTKLSSIILQMPEHNRQKLLNIAIKISEGLPLSESLPYRAYHRRRKSNRLMGVFIGFVLGFIFAALFFVSLSSLAEFLTLLGIYANF